MPQPFYNAVLTDKGAALITKAQAGECTIAFTRLATGDGVYTEEEIENRASQTALKSEKNSYAINDIEVYSDFSVKITSLITNQDPVTLETLVSEGYYINEMGLYAQEAGDSSTEILYSITVTTGEQGDFMPPYNGYCPVQIIQDFYATVNNSAEVTVETTGAAMLKEDVEKLVQYILDNTTVAKYEADTETLVLENFSSTSSEGVPSDHIGVIASATTLGHVKIGDNVDITNDGVITANGDMIVDNKTASEDEVEEMLDDVFGKE